jgi:hypothetical protein
VAEIRYHTVEHTGHSVADMRTFLTEETKKFIKMQVILNQDISVTEVQNLNRHRFLDKIRTDHLEWSEEQVRAEFERMCEGGDAPRDFFLTRDDIQNIKRKVQNDKFLHSRNEAQSVRLLIERVKKDGMLVYYQEQESVLVQPAAAAPAAPKPAAAPTAHPVSGATAAPVPQAPGATAAASAGAPRPTQTAAAPAAKAMGGGGGAAAAVHSVPAPSAGAAATATPAAGIGAAGSTATAAQAKAGGPPAPKPAVKPGNKATQRKARKRCERECAGTALSLTLCSTATPRLRPRQHILSRTAGNQALPPRHPDAVPEEDDGEVRECAPLAHNTRLSPLRADGGAGCE